MKNLTIFLSLFFFSFFSAQNEAEFQKVYTKTFIETSQKDMNHALKIADSLYQISETPLLKTKSLMLSASLYKQTGAVKKAISFALKSAEIIENTDNYIWQAKVFGFLASEYRNLKLYNQSKIYLDKASEISKKIENPALSNNIQGLMLQENAYYEIEKKNYNKAIENIKKSQIHFNFNEQNLDYFTAQNEQLLGSCFYELKNLEKAEQHYDKAFKLVRNEPDNYLTGLIYNGFALIYLDKNELNKAKEYLNKAEKIANKSDFLALKKEINSTSQKYFTQTEDVKNLLKVTKKQDSVKEQISTQSDEFVNQSFSALEKKQKVVEKESSDKNIFILVILIFLLGFAIYLWYIRKKNKEKLERFRKILNDLDEKLKTKENNSLITSGILVTEKVKLPKKSITMNAQTEQNLLSKLEEFENSLLFTDNNISLSSLAIFCETNPKYLSTAINTHKKKDFNNYINELRINFIIKKLKNEPLYRKYKIAVLAEEAGFSSQNKFSTIFKNETSISPSEFIKLLEEEKK